LSAYSNLQRSAQVRAQFLRPVERHHHRECQHAARLLRKTRSRPDFSPSVTRDQVLKRFVELISTLERSIHMLVSKHRPAPFHAFLGPLAFVHCWPPQALKNAPRFRVKFLESSMLERWAAFVSAYCAPGMCSARRRPSAGVVTGSCLPE